MHVDKGLFLVPHLQSQILKKGTVAFKYTFQAEKASGGN